MTNQQLPSSNLGTIITNPKARKAIYGSYALTCIAATATQVGFASVQAPAPDALTVAIAVLAYLGIPIGGLALANTTSRT